MPEAELQVEVGAAVAELLVQPGGEIVREDEAPVLLLRAHGDEVRPGADGGGDGCFFRDV